MKKWICAALATSMILASLASCDGGGDGTASRGEYSGEVSTLSTGEVVNVEAGIRYNDKNELLFLPEDVGEINNPIVTMLIPALSDDYYESQIKWREDAYGLEAKIDNCAWNEREMKWVSSYVAGTPYDILNGINYPTTVIKGLVQPIDDLLPIDDTRYFEASNKWNGKSYAVTAIDQYAEKDELSVSGVYGVFFNKELFDDNGLEYPSDLWDKGEWDFQAFYDAAKALTMDTDRDGQVDQVGCYTWMNDMYTAANGAQTVTITDSGEIKLTMNDPKYIEGLEWLIKCKPYASMAGGDTAWASSKAGMFVERLGTSKNWNSELSFEWDWVPYPKGPSGDYGYQGYCGPAGSGMTCNVGTGAKNTEGAKVFIAADLARSKYYKKGENVVDFNPTDAQLERCRQMKESGRQIKDYAGSVGSIGSDIWGMWTSIAELGGKAAVEKYTPPFQKEIDKLLATKVEADTIPFKTLGTVDFEDGKNPLKDVNGGMLSITDNAAEVISGSKSLKVQLSPNVAYGPYAITTAENYHFAYGGQYKVSFKAKAVNGTAAKEGPLVVSLRPSASAETGDDSVSLGGWNPVDLSDGQVHEFELMFNVMEFYDDLQLFLIGGTGAETPNLAIIIDDLTIEEIK